MLEEIIDARGEAPLQLTACRESACLMENQLTVGDSVGIGRTITILDSDILTPNPV